MKNYKDVKHALFILCIFASAIVMTISCAVAFGPPTSQPVPNPDIDIDKTTNGVDGPIVTVGSIVTWTYVVTNTGDVMFDQITVVDNQEGALSTSDITLKTGGDSDNLLEPGESWTYEISGIAISGPYSNSATVTGTIWLSTTESDTDTSSYTGEVPIPEFPTIAIPMLAIIGLAFVFTRRKE